MRSHCIAKAIRNYMMLHALIVSTLMDRRAVVIVHIVFDSHRTDSVRKKKNKIHRKSADEQHQCTKRKAYFYRTSWKKLRKMSNEWAEQLKSKTQKEREKVGRSGDGGCIYRLHAQLTYILNVFGWISVLFLGCFLLIIGAQCCIRQRDNFRRFCHCKTAPQHKRMYYEKKKRTRATRQKKYRKSQKCTYKYAKDVSLITLFARHLFLLPHFASRFRSRRRHIFVLPKRKPKMTKRVEKGTANETKQKINLSSILFIVGLVCESRCCHS